MKSQNTDNGFILKLNRGEEIIETLNSFFESEGISAGFFYGLGGVSNPEIAFYELERKEYVTTTYRGLFEVSNITGNLSQLDGKLALHVHITIAGSDLVAKAGHLTRAWVAGTLEIYFTTFNDELQRKYDEETGLNLLNL